MCQRQATLPHHLDQVEEAQDSIGEQDGKGPILDLVIVAGMQRIEHYEIAA